MRDKAGDGRWLGSGVGVLGDGGLLHTAVAARLTASARLNHRPVPGDLAGCSAIAVVCDHDDPGWYADARKVLDASGTPWLAVGADHEGVHIGPVTRAGEPGCVTCLARRRASARKRAQDHETVRRHHGRDLALTPSPLHTRLAAETVAELVGAELQRLVTGAPPMGGRFIRVDLRRLLIGRHRFLADPTCPDCGGLPDDSAGAALPAHGPLPKPNPRVFRVREVLPRADELEGLYVDEVAGLVRELRVERGAPFVRAVAPLSSLRGNQSQHGWGRTFDVPSSRITGLIEALERFGGERPRGKRTVVRACHRELADSALDPRSLGLYPDDRYEIPGFRYQRYDEDLVVAWVWGYSFARREPVLVPERYAYYAMHSAEDPRFVYEISNGCAIGNCLEEAILHGLLEIAERDAFLITWYARLPVPWLDPDSAADRTIPSMINQLRRGLGYDVSIFSTTMEQRIPSFWVMAVEASGDPARPRALCVGGSALDPEQGVVNALHELAHLLDHEKVYDSGQRELAARMVDDPSLVKIMGDHSLLYSHEAAFHRFDFLLQPRSLCSFADLLPVWDWPHHDDLRTDLNEMVGRYLDSGLDVVVVDQTAPEHRAGGFACVKVIVPGTLPMTFGYDNRRVDGLPRLLRVPVELGLRDRELTPADINPHPHPFP